MKEKTILYFISILFVTNVIIIILIRSTLIIIMHGHDIFILQLNCCVRCTHNVSIHRTIGSNKSFIRHVLPII